jgi:hypothetical protein
VVASNGLQRPLAVGDLHLCSNHCSNSGPTDEPLRGKPYVRGNPSTDRLARRQISHEVTSFEDALLSANARSREILRSCASLYDDVRNKDPNATGFHATQFQISMRLNFKSAINNNALISVTVVACTTALVLGTPLETKTSLLLAGLTLMFVWWHTERRRQTRRLSQEALLATMRALSDDVGLLACNSLGTTHPELRCELHIFERAVVRSLADLHHARACAAPLALIQRFVKVKAPALLATLNTCEDSLTLQSICRQFKFMSHRLMQRSHASAPANETLFAFVTDKTTKRPQSVPSVRGRPSPVATA